MHYGTEMNTSQFGVKKVEGQSHSGMKYAVQHFLGLLSLLDDFHETYTIDPKI